MLTFTQFLEELAKNEITLSRGEVERMRRRFGEKTLQMGNLQKDGSMTVPVDCILEAVQSIGSRKLNEAVSTLKNEEIVQMLESAESLVERVGEARERRLREMIREFQSEPEHNKTHQRWTQIEKEVFGVDFHD